MLHPLNHLMVSFPPGPITGVTEAEKRLGFLEFGSTPALVFDAVSCSPLRDMPRVRIGMLTGRVSFGNTGYTYNSSSDQLIRDDFRIWLINRREKESHAHRERQDGKGRLTCVRRSETNPPQ